MKTRNLIVILLSLVMFTNCYAQKPGKKERKTKTLKQKLLRLLKMMYRKQLRKLLWLPKNVW